MKPCVLFVLIGFLTFSASGLQDPEDIRVKAKEKAARAVKSLPGADFHGGHQVRNIEGIDLAQVASTLDLKAREMQPTVSRARFATYRVKFVAEPFDPYRAVVVTIVQGKGSPEDAQEGLIEHIGTGSSGDIGVGDFRVIENGPGDFCFADARNVSDSMGKIKERIYLFRDNVGVEVHAGNGVDLLPLAAAIDREIQKHGDKTQNHSSGSSGTDERKRCRDRLRILAAAKEHAALAGKRAVGELISTAEVEAHRQKVKPAEALTCPAGGVYYLGSVGETPTCSLHGNVLEGKRPARADQGHPSKARGGYGVTSQ